MVKQRLNKVVLGKDILGKDVRMKIKDLSFRPSVYGIVIKGNKVLLSKQWDGYNVPGGGVELGEPIQVALKREVLEETGITVDVGEVIECIDSFFLLPYTKGKVHSILMYFLCKKPRGKFSNTKFDEFEKDYIKHAEWVDIKNLKKLKFYNSADLVKIIQKAAKMK